MCSVSELSTKFMNYNLLKKYCNCYTLLPHFVSCTSFMETPKGSWAWWSLTCCSIICFPKSIYIASTPLLMIVGPFLFLVNEVLEVASSEKHFFILNNTTKHENKSNKNTNYFSFSKYIIFKGLMLLIVL